MSSAVELSLDQKKELLSRLQTLQRLADLREAASQAHREANVRWNEARRLYAELHALVVQDFGAEHAPVWIDAIHGPQMKAHS